MDGGVLRTFCAPLYVRYSLSAVQLHNTEILSAIARHGFAQIHSWNHTYARVVAHELGMSCFAKNNLSLSHPWGRARLDDAVGELECQGRRMVADREGVGADN